MNRNYSGATFAGGNSILKAPKKIAWLVATDPTNSLKVLQESFGDASDIDVLNGLIQSIESTLFLKELFTSPAFKKEYACARLIAGILD